MMFSLGSSGFAYFVMTIQIAGTYTNGTLISTH
jgi:hypothetical protein